MARAKPLAQDSRVTLFVKTGGLARRGELTMDETTKWRDGVTVIQATR